MTDDVRLTVGLATDLPGHFEDLVRCYQDRLYGFALRMLGSPQDAEEATQDAFVRAYRALERYPNDQRRSLQLRAWLYQITLNVVRNRVRRPSPRMVAIDGQVHDWPADDLADQPEARYTSRESQRELGQLVSELPAAFRAAVVLRH